MSPRKAGVTDGPKRPVLPGTRQRRPVGERLPCCPLGRRGAPRLCSWLCREARAAVAGGGRVETPRRVPGLRGACRLARRACAARGPNTSSSNFQPCVGSSQTPLIPPACVHWWRCGRSVKGGEWSGGEPAVAPHTPRARHSFISFIHSFHSFIHAANTGRCPADSVNGAEANEAQSLPLPPSACGRGGDQDYRKRNVGGFSEKDNEK